MRTRRKALLLTMCAALLVAGSIIGTVAYLTDSAEVKNTFTVGKISLTLDEAKVNEAGQPLKGDAVAEKGETADRWMPTDTEKSQSYHLLPGHSYTKDPTATVVKDSEDAYVRLLATISYKAEADEVFADTKADENDNLFKNWLDIDTTNWNPQTKVVTTKTTDEVTGKVTVTRTYEFRYYDATTKADKIVTRNSDADTKLPALFTTLTVPDELTNAQIATLEGMEITVVAHAMQASGFDDADAAWAAFDTQQNP